MRDEKFTLNHLVVTYFRCERIDFLFGSPVGSAVGCAWKPERNPWNSSRPLKGNSPVALLLINSWLKFYTTNSLYTKNHSKQITSNSHNHQNFHIFPWFFPHLTVVDLQSVVQRWCTSTLRGRSGRVCTADAWLRDFLQPFLVCFFFWWPKKQYKK